MATIAGFAILGLLLAMSACSKAIAKTGAGWRLRPRANFGNARGRGHACNGPNHRSATCARKEDAEETSRERHL